MAPYFSLSRLRERAGRGWLHFLHQLQPVAEGVFCIDPPISIHRLLDHQMAGRPQPDDQLGKPYDQQRRMRLSGRTEIGLDTEMNFERTLLEPGAATLGKVPRFGAFGNPEHILIEGPRFLLVPLRHGELHMLDGTNFHAAQPICSTAAARGGSRN